MNSQNTGKTFSQMSRAESLAVCADMRQQLNKPQTAKAGNPQPETKKRWQRKSTLDIMRENYPETKWVVPGVIPGGSSILAGPPKGMKSMWCLHLATAVSCGGCFMGCIPVEQREVLYLALEDNEQRIKNRLLKQGATGNENFFVETAKSWKGGIDTLRAYLKEFPETGLVIIDTLFMFSPMQDTNSYGDTYSPVSAIQKISTETEISILLVHHTRKGAHSNRGEAWADEGMGSQGINGAVDTIMLLQKQDGRNEGTLRIKGRDVEEKCFNLVFDSDICTWKITGESEIVKIQDTKARADLIAVLEKAGPDGMKTGEIAAALNKSVHAVGNLLKTLETLNRVKNAGYGRWILSQFNEVSRMNISGNVKSDKTGTFTVSRPLRENESVKVPDGQKTPPEPVPAGPPVEEPKIW